MPETDLLTLTAANVESVFNDCLTGGGEEVPIEGIVHKVLVDKDKLEEHRPEVESWINQLGPEFRRSGGGGWSFLNLCMDAQGNQWTGMHMTMEHLVMLAMGLGLASFVFPRDLWPSLPGGMPYVVFG